MSHPMKWATVTVVFASLGVLLAACGQHTTTAKQKVFKSTVNANPDTLDPAQYTLSVSAEVINAEQQGLYTRDANNKVVPGVVKAYTTNANKTVYTYTLKHTKWANGKPVTAADFVYAFERLADPKVGASQAARVDFLQNGQAVRTGAKPLSSLGAKALGTYKLQLTLSEPLTYLKDLLTGTAYMPVNRAFATKAGKKFGTSSAYVLANGPFKVKGFSAKDDTWTYVKNSQFWNKKTVKLDQVSVRVVKDSSTAANLFNTGKIDYAALTSENLSRFTNNKALHQITTPTIGYLSINAKRSATANVHLRRAIAESFDKGKFAKNVLKDGSKALDGLIPSNLSTNPNTGVDYRKDTGNLITFDPADAKVEWAKAQQELGKSTLNLTLLTADTEDAKNAGEFLQGQISSHLPGLHITLKSIPLAQRIALERSGDYDIAFGTWAPDFDDPINFLDIFQSSGQLNFSRYDSKAYDADLAKIHGALAAQPEARYQALQQAETRLIKTDVAIAPVYQVGLSYVQNPKTSHLAIIPFGSTVNYQYIEVK
ncbi:peptide ABC transporter substrate-binding protein [Lacticaseibacillus sp. N501-2]|uniref:peptide ABC transporter substrate-binding protein n=1 Tax=Lacticaseibacillus salsurae TaxID=3367729 RepID=UPI0038B4131B